MKFTEENYRKIFKYSNDAIFVIDPPRDRILEVNPKACSMLGYSRDELLSMKISDVHPYEMTGLLEFMNSVELKGSGWTNKLTCLTKSGEFLSAEISASSAYIEGKNCIIAMVRDMSQRIRIEKELQQSNLLQYLSAGTAGVTGTGFFRSLVRNLASALNVRYAFVTRCSEVDDNKVETLALWTGDGFSDNVEYDLTTTPCRHVIDGKTCYYPKELRKIFPGDRNLEQWNAESFAGVPVRDSHNRIKGHIAVIDDRPMKRNPMESSVLKIFAERAGAELERQKFEQSLKENEERFRTLFESSPIGISINNSNGSFIKINRAFRKMLGYREEELLGTGFKEITYHEDQKESMELFTGLVECKRSEFSLEKRYTKKNGTVIWANTHCSAVRDVEGNFIYTFAMVEDITDRKEAQLALMESLNQLSKKNRNDTIIKAITHSVHKSVDLQDVLNNAAEAINKNIDGLDGVEIFMVEGQDAVLKSHSGLPQWFTEKVKRIPFPEGYTWKVITGGKPRYCSNVDEDVFIHPAGRELSTRSYLSMPISYEGETVGCLNINSRHYNAFDDEELKLLETVARQIETAINNARQTEALKEALLEVEQLKNRLQEENIYLMEEIKTVHNFGEIIGTSESMRRVLKKLEQVAATKTTVLIHGETGTGKELIARAIHNLGSRKDRPLVKVNCAAISAGLVESELFGHEKGAFTGALQQRIGRFELADGGTIFLDEVGDIPPETQVKLLRVLQESEFERVGSSRSIKVDTRVIAATNRDLVEAIQEGRFRSDLFYRLSVFPVELPPLRERKPDIPLLAEFFLSKYSKASGKNIRGISGKSIELLMDYDWPGNIRELQNVIERAVVLSTAEILHIDESMLMSIGTGRDILLKGQSSDRLEDIERSHILNVLEKTSWVIEGRKGAASALGLNPSTLRSRMRKMGIRKER